MGRRRVLTDEERKLHRKESHRRWYLKHHAGAKLGKRGPDSKYTDEERRLIKNKKAIDWYHRHHPEARYGVRGRLKEYTDEERREKNRAYQREYRRRRRHDDPEFYAKELERAREYSRRKAALRPKRKKLSEEEKRERQRELRRRWSHTPKGREVARINFKKYYERHKKDPEWMKMRYEMNKKYRKTAAGKEAVNRASRKKRARIMADPVLHEEHLRKRREKTARSRDRLRAWRKAHPEYGRRCYLRKKWRYHNDPEYRRRVLERRHEYYRRHREQVLAWNKAYRERRKHDKNR